MTLCQDAGEAPDKKKKAELKILRNKYADMIKAWERGRGQRREGRRRRGREHAFVHVCVCARAQGCLRAR
jgi:hypothetical protein